MSRLPSVVVLMGPNGSGKSTLLKALLDVAQIAYSASPAEKNNPIKAFLPFASTKTMENRHGLFWRSRRIG